MNKMGTKLICDECQSQVIVTKGGDGSVMCHDAPMRVAGAGGARPASASQGSATGRQ
jgi:hypothetical protein